jgi:crotonobetainyl-CoA:carnitine CoA-transferase CaiB-like acyl-CoA transferase
MSQVSKSGGPLAGIRVVDLTTVVVGPTATLFLADYGAEVIKVEAPGGDILRTLGGRSKSGQLSGKFTHFNRNKRSLVLDLKQERAREALHKLLATADVFVANIRPSALERLGLGAKALREKHKKLIVCNLVGFGLDGRYAERPAYDSIIQAMSGVAACNERVLGEPKFVPMVMMDHAVGLIATQCILAALFHREKTGEAQAIEVPMFENAASFVLVEHLGDHSFVPPLGNWGDRRVLDPLAQPIQTSDGWIAVSANTDGQAFAFFDAVGRPELKTDPRFNSVKARYANVKEYFGIRKESLRNKPTEYWLKKLEDADVPAGRVHTMESLVEDGHLADVGLFRKINHVTEGTKIELNNPNKFSEGLRSEQTPAPFLGGQSIEILAELGYGEAEVKAMIEAQTTHDGRGSEAS